MIKPCKIINAQIQRSIKKYNVFSILEGTKSLYTSESIKFIQMNSSDLELETLLLYYLNIKDSKKAIELTSTHDKRIEKLNEVFKLICDRINHLLKNDKDLRELYELNYKT